MRRVVVSVRRRGHTRSSDFELPTDVPADDLAQQLAEAVGEPVGDGALDLRVVSLGRALHPDETLADAGVFDGATVVLARSADPPEQTVALAVAGGGSALATLAAPPPPVLAVPAAEAPRRAWLPLLIGVAVALVAIAVAVYALVLSSRPAAPDVPAVPAVAPTIASTSPPTPEASAPPPTAALAVPTLAPTSSAPVDDEDSAWRDLQAQLDQVWGDDWPATIGLLQAFHAQHPTRSAATDKLYAALVEYGRALRDADADAAAAESFDQAVRLAPQRREAREELAALTPTPTAVVAEAEAPAPALPVQREPPPALLPLPTTPPPAIPTPPPLEQSPAAADCDVTRSDIACPLADGMRVAEAFVRPGAPHFFWFGVPSPGMHLHAEANGPACPCTFWIFSDQVDDGATPLMAGAGALDQVIAAPGPYLLELASDQSAEGDYSLAFALQPAPEPTSVPEDPPTPLPPPPPPPPAPTPTPPPVPVPALVGAAVPDAQQRVLSAGLAARVQHADLFSPAGAGTVAAQDPPAGAQLAPGGSVTLLVASGNVQVPNVIGLFEQDAWAAVRQSGLDPDVRHVARSDVEAGRAALLDPPAGSVVPAGSKITLTISHGQ